MARLESVSLGGYYPTPPHLLSRIAALFAALAVPSRKERESFAPRVELSVMDPCAGDGAALFSLTQAIAREDIGRNMSASLSGFDLKFYACELEESRGKDLRHNAESLQWSYGKECLSGDAFQIKFEKKGDYGVTSGVSLLYLNPPYDTDRVHGRLEQRFLVRFTNAVATDGVLVFVVPFYALKASAELLGREYGDLRCFRFPVEDYAGYRQVVLYAKKVPSRIEADPTIVSQVNVWASDDSTIPELPGEDCEPLYSLPVSHEYRGGLNEWKMCGLDLTAILSKVQPWMVSTKAGVLVPVAGVIPEVPVQDTLLRQYPVATPPRPAHIAAGIASGLFNGARIEPKDPSTKLPSLLVKGVFDREYKTIEEKRDKDGNVKGVVQVQQPKLVVTVLDMKSHTYHILSTGTEETSSVTVATMNVADLLKHYGDSLMGVMERQCPVLYDPRRDGESIPLAPSPRRLFTAQAHASRAIVKLLGGINASKAKRKGRAAILLGEIGSGKSTVALMAGRTIGANRYLIMCPPHLLKSWENEIAAVLPEATVRVLANIETLQEAASLKASSTNPLICIMSREVGKLSHAWEGAGPVCPKCGNLTPKGDLAKKRARCEHKRLSARNEFAHEAKRLAFTLVKHAPGAHAVSVMLRERFDTVRMERYTKKPAPFTGLPLSHFDRALSMVFAELAESPYAEDLHKVVVALMLASWSEDRVSKIARLLMSANDNTLRGLAQKILIMLPPTHPEHEAIKKEYPSNSFGNYGYDCWSNHRNSLDALLQGNAIKYPMEVSWSGGLKVENIEPNSLAAVTRALALFSSKGTFVWQAECGEELFSAIPEPRRVSLARHITRYYRGLFDFLILDEGHEYSTDGSAQERAAHRLTTLQVPTVLMTGTIMNGYAESLFANMWALSEDFRHEFNRDECSRFVDRFGYRKRLVQDLDEEGEVIEFGSQSDRVTRSERVIGNAPGILPLFLLRHLLPISVTLHKKDLAIDLPACTMHRHAIAASPEVKKGYDSLQIALVTAIRRDQFKADRAGRLFGQLAELPSYLDRATSDVGNVESGDYEIRYPESLEHALVAAQPGLPRSQVLTKEQWMLDLVVSELAEGRNVMVFSWHVGLLPRLSRLIEERIGEKVPVLYANKVATGKRQDWIDREIVKKGRHVLVTNPVAIQTGLNNLVHFASEIWMENPACNPVTYRQAIGRVDRIGQRLETRIHFALYADTLQVQLYDLLMKKVAVSVSTDGLDPEAALQAAGLGEDDYLAGLSIGKQLWAMIGGLDVEVAAA